MGTNASNKKVASKIVAILLAALMLISVMPMTAFAIEPVEGKTVTIDGFTVTSKPSKVDGYYVGDQVELDGLAVEITYVYDEDVKNLGDKAPLYEHEIAYSDLATFIDDLDDFGVKCNYCDYVKGSVANKKLTMNNNVETLKFTYGDKGSKVWDSKIAFSVLPASWDAAQKVDIYESGEYVVVVNGKYVLTNKTVDTTVISGALSENALAVKEFAINSGIISDLGAQLKKLKLKEENIVWDATIANDANGNYTVELANDGKSLSDKEVKENAVAKSEWALVAADTGATWKMKDGKLFVEKTEKVTSVGGKEVENKNVPYYIAYTNGYLTLTKDAAKAAKIDLYKVVEAVDQQVKMIEIAKDANKMSYKAGEEFNADGMIVNVSYLDGTVICVPAVLFDVYGIDLVIGGYYADGYKLTVAENDQYVKAVMGEFYDMSNKVLKVAANELNSFVLTDGELKSGLYAIVWSDITDAKLLANKTYEGIALTSDKVAYDRLNKDIKSDYVITTLGGEDVTFRNNALGTVDGDKFVNGDNTMVWQVTAANNKYTISVPGTNTYLNRTSLDKYGEWALEGNGVTFDGKILTLGALCADSYWDIDGTVDAAIESFTTVSTQENYYVVLDGAQFVANTDISDAVSENFYFFKTETAIVAEKIEIKDQAESNYASGDKLDLSDLVVMVTYSNGTTVQVAYDDFNSYGITVNYADGATLSGADNGKNIVVSLGKVSATGAALKVADSNAKVTTVRLSGADRYATAAAIANSYVAALGKNYEKVAVLTSGTTYPDALAGATLASALKAPIVLTKADVLVDATKSFLADNGVKTVYVIGGTAAVSADVEASLKAMGIAVTRISGANRVETSVNVAKKLASVKGYSDTVILTNGANFADALSVSSAAAQLGMPVVYVTGDLDANVKAFITEAKATKAVILGGNAAVSADVEAAVKAMGLSVDRVSGADRFATGVAIAKYFASAFNGKTVTFATGKDFPDALAGGVYAAYVGAPVVLLDNGYVNASAAEYVASLELTNVYVFGGTGALSDATVNATLLK